MNITGILDYRQKKLEKKKDFFFVFHDVDVLAYIVSREAINHLVLKQPDIVSKNTTKNSK